MIAQPGTRSSAPAGVDTTRTGVTASVDALPSDVRQILAEAYADLLSAEARVADERKALAAALADAREHGAQINELARWSGLSKPTIYRLLREHAAGQTGGTDGTPDRDS